jgi:2-polyprenyl-6-methoxyphenol hydroxylase-like FAD-dependent oxidoreductase
MKRAVIVGGGIGGLTTALALAKTGWQVCVLERSSTPGEVGAGITLFPNAMRALDAIGVGDRIRALPSGRLPSAAGMRHPSGRWVVRIDGQPTVPDMYLVHRQDLHAALSQALPGDVLYRGTEVIGAQVDSDGVRVRYRRDGGFCAVDADLLIGADGVRSRVRGQYWPAHPGPAYAGYTSWRGVTATRFELPGGGETWGRGCRFGILPLGDDRVYWFATANTPAGIRHPDERAELLRRFGDWHPPIPDLLAATGPEEVLRHDTYELRTPLPSYVADRVALVGDAAHAMTPDLGQGACQAIEDAVTLAATLAATTPLADALRRYDSQRRPRTQSIVRLAHRMTRFGQADGTISTALRDLAVRLTPPGVAARGLDRITAWSPPPIGTLDNGYYFR